MKATIKLFVLFLLFTSVLNSCKNEVEYNTYDAPNWTKISGDYSESMTAVIELPLEVIQNLSNNDEIAAFMGDECRGVAHQIDGKFFINIQGKSDEGDIIVFRYYSAKNRYLYEDTRQLKFEPDAVLGTVDNPYYLVLTIL